MFDYKALMKSEDWAPADANYFPGRMFPAFHILGAILSEAGENRLIIYVV